MSEFTGLMITKLPKQFKEYVRKRSRDQGVSMADYIKLLIWKDMEKNGGK